MSKKCSHHIWKASVEILTRHRQDSRIRWRCRAGMPRSQPPGTRRPRRRWLSGRDWRAVIERSPSTRGTRRARVRRPPQGAPAPSPRRQKKQKGRGRCSRTAAKDHFASTTQSLFEALLQPHATERTRWRRRRAWGAAAGAHQWQCRCVWLQSCSRCARARRSCSSSRAGTGQTFASSPRSWRDGRKYPLLNRQPWAHGRRGAGPTFGATLPLTAAGGGTAPSSATAPGRQEAECRSRSAARRRWQAVRSHVQLPFAAKLASRNGGRGKLQDLFLFFQEVANTKPCCCTGLDRVS